MAKKRNTKTKQMVRAILENSDKALSHEDIETALEGQMDRVTIYRILQSFEEEGLTHRITDESGKWYYAMCQHCEEGHHHDNHIHFQCTECHSLSCLDITVSKPHLPTGYSIKEINYLISGCCPNCRHI